MKTKICSRCGQEKPLSSEFWHLSKVRPDGVAVYCKPCTRNYRLNAPKKPIKPGDMKICPHCRNEKPLTKEFWPFTKSAYDGYQGWCKECHNSSRRDNQRKQSYKEKIRILTHYCEGVPYCICPGCNITDSVVLTLDHIHGGGNKHRKETGPGHTYRWIIKNKFPPGFRVLCFNCNWASHYQGCCTHHAIP